MSDEAAMRRAMNNDSAARALSFRESLRAWALADERVRADAQSGALDAEIDAGACAIEHAQSGFKVDEPSAGIVAHAALVAASYCALRNRGVPQNEAVERLTSATTKWMMENAEAYSFARLGVSSAKPETAFQSVRENFLKRGEERFGSHFKYESDIGDERRSFVNITRCLYNDLLRSIGYPEVIPVFCAMDTIWAANVTQPRYKLHFERPTTLAAGDDKCRFQFSKANEP